MVDDGGGRQTMYQPVYLELRDDVEPADCRVSQLKYNAGEESC
jgi:hypothetical protein